MSEPEIEGAEEKRKKGRRTGLQRKAIEEGN